MKSVQRMVAAELGIPREEVRTICVPADLRDGYVASVKDPFGRLSLSVWSMRKRAAVGKLHDYVSRMLRVEGGSNGK